MKLGQRLLGDAAIDRDQLIAALREQVLTGARLGSQLVALGYLWPEVLSAALAAATGVPAASAAELAAPEREARERLDEGTARRRRALPLAFTAGRQKLICAVVDPRDELALAALEHAARMPIEPRVAPEAVILAELDRLYAPIEPPSTDEVGAVHGTRAANRMTRPIRIGPGALAPPRQRPQPIPLSEGQKLLDAATQREQIGEALLVFARGRLDAALLLAVRGDRAVGWRGLGPGLEDEPVDGIVLHVDGGPYLTEPVQHRRILRGKTRLPESLLPLTAMVGPKGELVSVPVILEDRVLCVLIGTSRQGVDEHVTRALEQHAQAAARTFAKLLDSIEP